MSAYNEEGVIRAKMDRLLEIAQAYGPATIHVYVDAPSDATASILHRYADRADIVFGQQRMGKTFGMNTLVKRSNSDFILFTDANVESSIDVARELAAPMLADPSIGCTTARLVYSNRKETATANLGALYWGMEEAIKRLESRIMGLIGCDGAMFMMRRALHVSPPPHLIDDLYLSLTILIAKSRIVSVDHVEVFERSATRPAEEGHRKRRIACQAWNVHRALWPQLRRLPATSLYAYISHRPIKWLMPFFVLASMTSLLTAISLKFGSAPALIILAILVGSYLLGACVSVPPFSMFHSAVRSLAGIGIGTIESFALRKTYTTWNPATSVRDQERSRPAP
jgi:Glycosyltransferases, probably involved in cell wall biogenesis